MRNLLLISILLMPFLAFSQRTYSDDAPGLLDKRKKKEAEPKVKPKKNDGYVLVISALSLRQVAAKLISENYIIERLDTSFGTLLTQPKIIPGRNGEYFLNVVKSERGYKLCAMMRWNFTASLAGISSAKGAYEVGRFYKSTGSGERRAFDAAQDAGKLIGEIEAYVP